MPALAVGQAVTKSSGRHQEAQTVAWGEPGVKVQTS